MCYFLNEYKQLRNKTRVTIYWICAALKVTAAKYSCYFLYNNINQTKYRKLTRCSCLNNFYNYIFIDIVCLLQFLYVTTQKS